MLGQYEFIEQVQVTLNVSGFILPQSLSQEDNIGVGQELENLDALTNPPARNLMQELNTLAPACRREPNEHYIYSLLEEDMVKDS